MSKRPIGSLIAIQKGGKVYMGFVASHEGETCTVDVIADDVYRGARPQGLTGNAITGGATHE